jgi:hypothetical protein
LATYYFNDRTGLTPNELFFWVTVDTALTHLGLDDVVAMSAILAGQPWIPTKGKFGGATKGTSLVSSTLSRRLNVQLPFRLPTLTGRNLASIRVMFTNNLGRFAGRTVPVLGWIWLTYDVSHIVWTAVNRYNRIALAEDRLW